MADILVLATAGPKPDQLSDADHVHYPRVDFLELQRFINMDILDYIAYNHTRLGSFFRRLETQLRSDLYLTMLGMLREHRYRLVFAMSERVGIPFAGLHHMFPFRRPFVSMHHAWSWRQEALFTRVNLFSLMDAIILHCQSMRRDLLKLGVPAERLHVIPYGGVDDHFFSPLTEVEQQAGLAMSIGEIRHRDYATLFQAVDGLSLKLFVAASGRWYAREKKADLQTALPNNVTIAGYLSYKELKETYARSQFIVLPLPDLPYAAGVTAILEAMCMERAVIVTRSRGILDYVVDGETGILVNPGDVAAMRETIQDLRAHPEEARRLGQNGRQRIEEELNLDVYVERIATLLRAHL